jgi:hypothetical protein
MEAPAFSPTWIFSPDGQSLIATRESEYNYYKGLGWGSPSDVIAEPEAEVKRNKPRRKPKNG